MRLLEQDGLTQVALARLQRVEPSSMCRMVDRLERDGLVERRPHPGDRRASCLFLTAAGRAAAAGAWTTRAPSTRRSSAALGRGAEALADLLERVLGRLAARRAAPARSPRTRPRPALGLTMAGLITAAMAYALMQTFLIPALPVLQRELGTSADLGHLDRHRLPAQRGRGHARSSAASATSSARSG